MGKKDNKFKVLSFDALAEFSSGGDEINYEEGEAMPLNEQKLKVLLDRKQRKGKDVTIVENFQGSEEDLKALGKELKTKCGFGGSVKDGLILIQGDHRRKVVDILLKLGYSKTKGVNI